MAMLWNSAAASAEVAADLRGLQRLWWCVLFVLGLGYALLIPPFQAVDEIAHWDRMWSVAEGDYNCWKIQTASRQFARLTFRFDRQPELQPVAWSVFREGWEFVGDPGKFWVATNGCHYPPIGYVLPAITMRLLSPGSLDVPRPHRAMVAHYGARLSNLLLFFGCAFAAFRISRFPMPVLIFASIPMVLHQAASINNDALQFAALLLASALLTRAPTRQRLWGAIGLIALISAIKPINACAAPFVWWSLHAAYRERRYSLGEVLGTGFVAAALPIALWLVWHATMQPAALGEETGTPVPFVDGAVQLAQLRAEPLRILKVLAWNAEQLFTMPAINGGWRGVLLALGWYRHLPPDYVYAFAFVALGLGLLLLRFGARGPYSEGPVPGLLVWSALCALFAYYAAVTLILYLEFTPIGHPHVNGVQGRYYLYPIGLFLFLCARAIRGPLWLSDKAAKRVAQAFLVASLLAHVAALYGMRQLFWEA